MGPNSLTVVYVDPLGSRTDKVVVYLSSPRQLLNDGRLTDMLPGNSSHPSSKPYNEGYPFRGPCNKGYSILGSI